MTISISKNDYWKKNQSLAFELFRPIAQRQIKSLLRRMELTQNRVLYLEEIKKVISDEQDLFFRKQRGEEID